MNRKLVIVLGVIALHIAVLWTMQTSLRRRATEQIVSVEILSEIIRPPIPQVAPPPTVPPLPRKPPRAPAPVNQPIATPAAPLQPPAPQASADANPTPPSYVAPAVAAPGPVGVPVAIPVVGASSAAARVELPSSDADHLEHPPPPYPRLSKRLGEQGTVRVKVLIGADGLAKKVEIEQSSGFERLDQAALGAALGWRYVPRKNAGVPVAKWVVVPIPFVLTD